MNEQQLSKRLQAVSTYIPTGSRLADIGSDHAYLPINLMLQGKISMAIAGEVNEGPWQSAHNNVEKYELEGVVDVRKGDGLAVIQEDEVDVIVIAGMGGALITDILNNGLEKLLSVKRLILQPNVASHLVRQWFIVHQWELKAETIVEEDGQYYEVLMAEQGDPEEPYNEMTAEQRQKAILMGPFLLAEKNEAFLNKWTAECKKRKQVVASLQKATNEESKDKLQWVEKELQMIKEEIQ